MRRLGTSGSIRRNLRSLVRGLVLATELGGTVYQENGKPHDIEVTFRE
jgi:hypothetical protein